MPHPSCASTNIQHPTSGFAPPDASPVVCPQPTSNIWLNMTPSPHPRAASPEACPKAGQADSLLYSEAALKMRDNYQMPFFKTIGALALCCSLAAAMDLRTAIIWVAPGAASPEKKAAIMLSEEIAKRTQIRLELTNAAPPAGRPVIALGLASELGSRAS